LAAPIGFGLDLGDEPLVLGQSKQEGLAPGHQVLAREA
jgi:hypothetical protein